MRRHIGRFLTKENVTAALQLALSGERKLHKGTKYAVLYEGERFGPKALADLAIELDGKVTPDQYYRHGAVDKFHHFLRELKFEIVDKDGNPLPDRVSDDYITRLCFNTENWTEPTGPDGKSNKNHEGIYGYGHEEWLFDLSRIIDGYHYGFIEAFRDNTASHDGELLNIRFYTIDGRDKKRYWAGRITGVEVIGPEEAEEVRQEYERLGWLASMNEQLIAIQRKIPGIDPVGFSNYRDLQFFNLKFRPESLDRRSIGRQIPRESRIMSWQRYNLNKESSKLLLGIPDFQQGSTLIQKPTESIQSITYTPSGEPVEMYFIHDEMSRALTRKLEDHYKDGKVTREDQAGFGRREVDIVVARGGKTIFFEIKTNLTLPMAIRAAIGQLMEYCHWSEEMRADYWVIVTQPFIDTKAAELYLQHLRSLYEIPIYLQTFEYETGTLTPLLPRSAFRGQEDEIVFL